ncbi:hypothetical protein VTK73DRAFT_6176 [Phialemonium thermophilum]|uniref:DRBM domain-containing protein n=1 Tax=Phialemonium thermophilum TaxID=223376 RepID=A0ABR3WKQ2_9PEZI
MTAAAATLILSDLFSAEQLMDWPASVKRIKPVSTNSNIANRAVDQTIQSSQDEMAADVMASSSHAVELREDLTLATTSGAAIPIGETWASAIGHRYQILQIERTHDPGAQQRARHRIVGKAKFSIRCYSCEVIPNCSALGATRRGKSSCDKAAAAYSLEAAIAAMGWKPGFYHDRISLSRGEIG